MGKTLIGPQLRQLRRDRKQTQLEMAKALGVSASYINLLENNQRSLSVQMLMALSDAYDVDWRALTQDDTANRVGDLRAAMSDPLFDDAPDLAELRGAVEHAPKLVDCFLHLYRGHRAALDKMMRLDGMGKATDLLRASPETLIHDYFRNHSNHFPELEHAADSLRKGRAVEPEALYGLLRTRLTSRHGLDVRTAPIDEMNDALRIYDEDSRMLLLSQALNHENRVFQLAHMICLIEFSDLLDSLLDGSGIGPGAGLARIRVEMANYFAGAVMMPYGPFLEAAERNNYDLDRIASVFDVSFEQVCHRLTTLQRDGAQGVPFFFLRVDRAGNVTKRFNSTSFQLAEYGGACPVWNIHTAFSNPGVVVPQFVELPDGGRFFTISRTAHRPVFSQETQDRRLILALGCELRHAHRISYARGYETDREAIFGKIGINCHLCQRQDCAQRAHQPMLFDLQLDANRRGSSRYDTSAGRDETGQT
ncbi:MAG: short-chain fatty acyl-CoA regulator family protein [Pseudomonadota bacterium]